MRNGANMYVLPTSLPDQYVSLLEVLLGKMLHWYSIFHQWHLYHLHHCWSIPPATVMIPIPSIPIRLFLHLSQPQAGMLSINLFQLINLLCRSPPTDFPTRSTTEMSSPCEVETGGYDFITDGPLPSSDIGIGWGGGSSNIGLRAAYPNRPDNWRTRLVARSRE